MSGTSKQFYVLSLKHSRGDFVTWWGPNCCGYTRFLSNAGLYNEDEVAKKKLNDGETTLAIPVDDVLQHVKRVVFIDDIHAVCKQQLYQVDGRLETEAVFQRENERRKKEAEERKKKIADGTLCEECEAEGFHNEWCSKYGEEEDDGD